MEKIKISNEVYDALMEWKNNLLSSKRIYSFDIADMFNEPEICYWWRGKDEGTDSNNRLIEIIRWVNGEDVFELEDN